MDHDGQADDLNSSSTSETIRVARASALADAHILVDQHRDAINSSRKQLPMSTLLLHQAAVDLIRKDEDEKAALATAALQASLAEARAQAAVPSPLQAMETLMAQMALSTKNLKYWPGRACKLLPRFVGPFPVTRVYDKHGETLAATLDLPVGWRIHPTFHVSLLKAYVPDGSPMIRPNPDHFRTTDEPVYDIGRVVDHKIEFGLLRYYVQWLHSDHVHTWELEPDLAGPCATDIDLY
eukprot:gene7575-biopygen17357